MSELSVDIRFAFQPLVNLHTGGVVAMEMLARPAHGDVQSLLRSAAHAGELEQVYVAQAVAAAAECSSDHETLLPLHLNLTADTVAAATPTLAPLHRSCPTPIRRRYRSGNLLGPPHRRPVTTLPIAGIADFQASVCPAPLRGRSGIDHRIDASGCHADAFGHRGRCPHDPQRPDDGQRRRAHR